MKWQRVLALLSTGLLMWSAPIAAQGLYFDNEGLLVPSENSQSVFNSVPAAGITLLETDDRIDVIPDAENFPDIVVITTIRDADGNPVPGLGAGDVTVTEQSDKEAAPTVETPTCFETLGDESVVSFSLAVDVSSSMYEDNKLTEAKAAANLFLDVADEADQGALVSFAGCGHVDTPFPLAPIDQDLDGNGVPDIRERIDELSALGSTAVYDGIAQAVETLGGTAAPKGIVVLTDGMTNSDCTDTINSVIEKARAASVPIYTIGLAIPADSTMAENLRIIADQTGGTFSLAPTPEDLAAIYLKIAGDIRAQYRICYTTHNPALDGTTRTVTIRHDDAAGTGTYTVGSLPENQPPVITHDPVTRADENTPVPISAQVTDPDPDDAVDRATLFFRTHTDDPDAPFTELAMTAPAGGDVYSAIIPGNRITAPGVDYYISAWDKNGARADSGSPVAPYFIQVTLQPIADAGPDQIVKERETVILDGRASSSSIEGEAPRFSWRQTMGPVVAITGASTARPTFEAPEVDLTETVLIFELTVTNSLGDTDSDTVWVTVEKDSGCEGGDCGSGSGGCFIDTLSTAPGWLWRLIR